eukprot:5665157-Prymnesium_polylepis.2
MKTSGAWPQRARCRARYGSLSDCGVLVSSQRWNSFGLASSIRVMTSPGAPRLRASDRPSRPVRTSSSI